MITASRGTGNSHRRKKSILIFFSFPASRHLLSLSLSLSFLLSCLFVHPSCAALPSSAAHLTRSQSITLVLREWHTGRKKSCWENTFSTHTVLLSSELSSSSSPLTRSARWVQWVAFLHRATCFPFSLSLSLSLFFCLMSLATSSSLLLLLVLSKWSL